MSSSRPKPFSDSETIKDVVILYCIFGILLCGNKSISKMLSFFKPQELLFSQNIVSFLVLHPRLCHIIKNKISPTNYFFSPTKNIISPTNFLFDGRKNILKKEVGMNGKVVFTLKPVTGSASTHGSSRDATL